MAKCTPVCCAASQHQLIRRPFVSHPANLQVTDTKSKTTTLDTRVPAGVRCTCCAATLALAGRWAALAHVQALARLQACRLWQGQSLPCSNTVQASTLLLPHPSQAAPCTRLPCMAALLLRMTIMLLPAGFLNSVATFIPAVAGVDLESLVKQARRCCLSFWATWLVSCLFLSCTGSHHGPGEAGQAGKAGLPAVFSCSSSTLPTLRAFGTAAGIGKLVDCFGMEPALEPPEFSLTGHCNPCCAGQLAAWEPGKPTLPLL